MQLIVCLDNHMGMCFNKRRQSRDRAVIDTISSIVGENKLYISEYSMPLFEQSNLALLASDNYLDEAVVMNGIAFSERESVDGFINKIDKLYVFLWNRDYPSDFVFPMNVLSAAMTKTEIYDFVGSSHEKITLEVYER